MTPENREYLQSDYLEFVKYIFEMTQGAEFVENHHHEKIAAAMVRVILGETKRLIINVPPRYSKTEMAVVSFIPYAMGIAPDSHFIHASYSKRLAAKNAYNARAIMMSEAYQDVFPDVAIKDDSKAKDEWKTRDGGVLYATGTYGTITGYGAGRMRPGFGGAIIIDDPHKPTEAESDVVRQSTLDWFQNTLESRTNSPETPIIVIMQRLHSEDLAGWLLAGGNGEDWEHLMLPAEDDNGEPLWEYKHTRSDLARLREKNSYVYAGQYLQLPGPKEGAMIKKAWPKRYINQPYKPIMIIQSWDTANKEKEINDPSVCTTWMVTKEGYFLIDVYAKRMDYPTLKRTTIEMYQKHQPSAVLIEDKSSGQSLIQDLRSDSTVMVPAIPIEPEGDKVTRMSAESPAFESGLVWFPEEAPWLATYEEEIHTFPNSKKKDQVDSTSQFLKWIRMKAGDFSGVTGMGQRESVGAYGQGMGEIDEDTGFGRVRSTSNYGDF